MEEVAERTSDDLVVSSGFSKEIGSDGKGGVISSLVSSTTSLEVAGRLS